MTLWKRNKEISLFEGRKIEKVAAQKDLGTLHMKCTKLTEGARGNGEG